MTDTKTATRQAAVGRDFGADTAAFDPSEGVAEDVAQDKRGVLLTDFQSYERIIEGLKLAADSARHRAYRNEQNSRVKWDAVADKLDKARQITVRASGFNRLQDGNPSLRIFGGEVMNRSLAASRIKTGLKDAAAGCRQVSNCHRSVGNGSKEATGFEWLKLAIAIEQIGDWVKEIEQSCTPLRVDSQWMQ